MMTSSSVSMVMKIGLFSVYPDFFREFNGRIRQRLSTALIRFLEKSLYCSSVKRCVCTTNPPFLKKLRDAAKNCGTLLGKKVTFVTGIVRASPSSRFKAPAARSRPLRGVQDASGVFKAPLARSRPGRGVQGSRRRRRVQGRCAAFEALFVRLRLRSGV
jgi:hypothetical protein